MCRGDFFIFIYKKLVQKVFYFFAAAEKSISIVVIILPVEWVSFLMPSPAEQTIKSVSPQVLIPAQKK